jgi:hypothetical protein
MQPLLEAVQTTHNFMDLFFSPARIGSFVHSNWDGDKVMITTLISMTRR